MSDGATVITREHERHAPGHAPASPQPKGVLRGLIAEFDSPAALKRAARAVREAGYTRFDAHSPFPIHGIDSAVGIRMTKLPWIVMIGGVAGCLTGLGLQWWANATNAQDFEGVPTFLQGYNFLVSGKPYFSLPANIPVIFELTVLLAALTTFIAMLAMNNLPLFYNPIFNSRRFRRVTDDRFFLVVDARDRRFEPDQTEAFLDSLGGLGVEPVLEFPSPAKPPLLLRRVMVFFATLLLLPPVVAWLAWHSKSEAPRIHIVPDMDNQPKFRAQHATPLFADQRAMRPALPGTVARDTILDDPHFTTGIVDGQWASTMPLHREGFVVDEALLARGRERFNVYCAPCHGRTGDGQGMVANRGLELGGPWVAPANLHEQQYRERPLGHLFNTITNGIRTMPPYGFIIPPQDRWAIVAYVRALQRSEFATLDDVPEAQRATLRELPRPQAVEPAAEPPAAPTPAAAPDPDGQE